MSSARRNGPTDMTDRDPMLARFDALIGTWSTEATHPLFDGVVLGSATFEWLEDGVLRWWRNHPGFDQRSCAKLGPDAFEFVHQLAETPGDWRDDLRATYRRRA